MENKIESLWAIAEKIRLSMSTWKIQRAKCGTVVPDDRVTEVIYNSLLNQSPDIKVYAAEN